MELNTNVLVYERRTVQKQFERCFVAKSGVVKTSDILIPDCFIIMYCHFITYIIFAQNSRYSWCCVARGEIMILGVVVVVVVNVLTTAEVSDENLNSKLHKQQ